MIWLTWRQMRAQTLWTAGVLAAIGAYLLYLAAAVRESYRVNVTECTTACDEAAHLFGDEFGSGLLMLGLLLLAGPALIGAFWGAPLITRELETGTHRLVWNQSVTRTRWLAVKLVIVGGVSVLFTGTLSLLLTWAAGPYDKLVDSRFEPLTFAARDLAPFGYAILAFTLGLVIGVLVRKTLAAMALTLVAFVVFQLLMANVLRPHFTEPVTETITWADANTVGQIDAFGIGSEGAGIQEYQIQGAWVLDDLITVYKGDGTAFDESDLDTCDAQGATTPDECLRAMDATFDVTYHPADRYWTFQWIELGGALALSAVLLGVAFWRIPRGIN
ncbi:ABC transporter permease subunit [Glycomyces harbinensis]|uniref:ABC-2 family transporter protein n=1 Tax=Glycomyces harbinensis TaxID=58114 RepID=A0A1G6RCF3_9ACTN|nr:ABC transporter permease subunit [Glycomyces harbinensis]SDD02228.1 ABC-2 family transporter protein [Glycomyces harbinensis]